MAMCISTLSTHHTRDPRSRSGVGARACRAPARSWVMPAAKATPRHPTHGNKATLRRRLHAAIVRLRDHIEAREADGL